jgi:hypothetical protein
MELMQPEFPEVQVVSTATIDPYLTLLRTTLGGIVRPQ